MKNMKKYINGSKLNTCNIIIQYMGYLSSGKTLSWKQSLPYIQQIKENGIKQFLQVYKTFPKKKDCPFMFGDEIEYTLLKLDKNNKTVAISLTADKLIDEMSSNPGNQFIWHPEYANYMIEGTPGKPFDCNINNLLKIYDELISRRSYLKKFVGGDTVVSITTFPRLGCKDSSQLSDKLNAPFSHSSILSDEVIGGHIRFTTLTENIRLRRGKKVQIDVPVYQDSCTKIKQLDLDCMCFGMGCSCLQVTFQLKDETEARYIYDMFAIFAPIMLAITAASPIQNGYLVETDCRWDIIAKSVDDRYEGENKAKSRYDAISLFISDNEYFKEYYNDIEYEKDESIDKLLPDTIDKLLRNHLNYLFIRDPLVIYEDGLVVDPVATEGVREYECLDCYENIHSTNWNTVRLKIPVPEVCGWRVEFRPMELQKDDVSNGHIIVFMNLLVRTLTKLRPDWYIPISKVDENMKSSQKMDSIKEQFYWKIDGKIDLYPICKIVRDCCRDIRCYLSTLGLEKEQIIKLEQAITFVEGRSCSAIPTDARIIRDFVLNHPNYKKDSYVSNEICYDLIMECFV